MATSKPAKKVAAKKPAAKVATKPTTSKVAAKAALKKPAKAVVEPKLPPDVKKANIAVALTDKTVAVSKDKKWLLINKKATEVPKAEKPSVTKVSKPPVKAKKIETREQIPQKTISNAPVFSSTETKTAGVQVLDKRIKFSDVIAKGNKTTSVLGKSLPAKTGQDKILAAMQASLQNSLS